MSEKIRLFIRNEIKENKANIGDLYIDVITDAVYKQLAELFPKEGLEVMVQKLGPVFEQMIDAIIPIVQEYEEKVDEVLTAYVGKLLEAVHKAKSESFDSTHEEKIEIK